MSKFLRITTYKIPQEVTYINSMAKFAKELYTVARSNGFLFKLKTDEFDDVEERFLRNLLYTDFSMYSYLTYTDWSSDSVLAVFPDLVKLSNKDSKFEQSDYAFHCTVMGPGEVFQQSLSTFSEVVYDDNKYLVVTTAHTPLLIAINDKGLAYEKADSYSIIDRLLNVNVPFIKGLEKHEEIIFNIEDVDLTTREIKFKDIEGMLIYDDTHNRSKIYQSVVKVFPETVISDITATDELSNIETFDIYRVTEEDLEEVHEDLPDEDVVFILSGEDAETVSEEDYLYRETGIKVYKSDNSEALFRELNGFNFNVSIPKIEQIRNETILYVRGETAGVSYNSVTIGDMLIDANRLPAWRKFLLIPYIREVMLKNVDLENPDTDLLNDFLTYVEDIKNATTALSQKA